MIAHLPTAIWPKIYSAWLFFWDFCISLGCRLFTFWDHLNRTGSGLPLPAASSHGRPVNLPFPLPAFIKDSRCHRKEFEACQTRLRQSVRLQKTTFQMPKRCTTPLLPFHEIPGQPDDEDYGLVLSVPKHPWDEESEISLSSSPSPTLHTPMSTSNPFDRADPFVHYDESYTPLDRVGILSSPFLKEQDDFSLINQLHSSLDYDKPSTVIQNNNSNGDTTPCIRRRQFCGCRNPCSNYMSISPTPGTFSPTDRNSRRIDPLSDWISDNLQRWKTFGNTSLQAYLSRQTLLGEPVLDNLGLVFPKFSIRPYEEDSIKHITETEENVAETSAVYRRSDIYESWKSSWCFRPAILRPQSLPLTEIMVPSSPQLGLSSAPPFASPQLLSQQLNIEELNAGIEAPKSRGSNFLCPPTGMLARNSRVVSGVNKLRNLRDLLLILDQILATSAICASQFSDGQLHELHYEEFEPMWGSDFQADSGRAF